MTQIFHKLQTPKETAILSVNEAKKIMGANSSNMSDEQVEELIIKLTNIAKAYIKNSSKKTYFVDVQSYDKVLR